MKHSLKISISKKPSEDGIVMCRHISARERVLTRLLGETRRVAIIVPGDTVECVSIIEERGSVDERYGNTAESVKSAT